jgi:hypothetical protein
MAASGARIADNNRYLEARQQQRRGELADMLTQGASQAARIEGLNSRMSAMLASRAQPQQSVAGVRDYARKAFQFVAPIAAVAATAALGHKYGTPAYDNYQTRQNAAAHRREYMWRQL